MSKFDKVVGYEDIKAELIRICDVVKNPEKYARLGVHMPRGILLWGEPGLGKSLMAQCFIEESGCKSFTVRKDKPDGELVRVICDVFAEAKAEDRAIVFLDDLDKFANEDSQHPDAEEYVAVQAGIDACRDSDVFVIATANDRDCFPESLLRSGRFDKVIELNCPKGEEAAKVVRHYLSRKESLGDVDAVEIAEIMDGNSCAALEAVVNEAGIFAGYDGRDKISHRDMLRACLRMLFDGPECVAQEEYQYVKDYAVHEAGHAVVAEQLEPGSVILVSVLGYAGKCRGITKICRKNEHEYSKTRMERDILCKLAGKAATELVFGKTDVGCTNDLGRAFHITNRLVDDLCAFGFDTYTGPDSSEAIKGKMEQTVAMEINKYYQQAKKILAENRVFLDKLTAALVEKKMLTRKEIQEIRENPLAE